MIWKIIDICPKYEISNFGIVRKVKDKKVKKTSIYPGGYEVIGFQIKGFYCIQIAIEDVLHR